LEVQRSSFDPSLIPETPAAQPTKSSTRIIIDGYEYDEEDTIVVDTSSLKRKDGRPTANRGGATRKPNTYASTKRKFLVEDPNEVPDSQDAKGGAEKKGKRRLVETASEIADSPVVKATAQSMQPFPCCPRSEPLTFPPERPPKKISPTKKRQSGRLKRVSQVSQLETDADVDQSQSPSVDLDASVLDASVLEMEIDDSTTDVLTSDAKETTVDEEVEEEELLDETRDILRTIEDVSSPDEDIDMAETAEELFNSIELHEASIDERAPASEDRATTPDIDRIEETIINEGAFKDESSPAAETPSSDEDPSAEVVATSSDLVDSPALAEEQASTAEPNEVAPEISENQRMKGKLESFIEDLKSAALSREEISEYEDMFYDAKEHLYGAARRWRERERNEMKM
jgi:hypothetical protein